MPLVALLDGVRVRATREGPRRAACAGCGLEMIAKTGDVVTWHWAHAHTIDAESCHVEHETEWHLGWKTRCGDADRIEVARGARRADVLTPYGWAVEFQHSAMDVREATARERDWRRRLVWVVDARDAYAGDRLVMRRPQGRAHLTLRWAWSPAWVRDNACRTFLDVGDDRLVMVGRWYEKDPDRPVVGYGWSLSAEQFTRCVLDGHRPPRTPPLGVALDPEEWAAPRAELDCPACGSPLSEPAACSAARYHQGAA